MLSNLQRYILYELAVSRRGTPRMFRSYYARRTRKPKELDQQTSIIRSIERLIDQGYLVGKGRRTKEKWFVDEVSLTPQGRKKSHALMEQRRVPLFTLKRTRHGNSKKS